MDKTLQWYKRKLYWDRISDTEKQSPDSQNYRKLFTLTQDSSMIVAVRTKTTLAELETVL